MYYLGTRTHYNEGREVSSQQLGKLTNALAQGHITKHPGLTIDEEGCRRDVEVAFENVRKEHYPDYPSRTECAFLCTNPDTWRGKHRPLLYRLEAIEVVNHLEVDTVWYNLCVNKDPEESIEERAHRYWRSEKSKGPKPETLVVGRFRTYAI